jgi:predicted nucleotidyltransferase
MPRAGDAPPFLRRVIDRYVRAFRPERIVMFGSHAKGTAKQGSDVDVLVVATLAGDHGLHMRRARQLAVDCFPPVDVVFASPEEVATAATAESPFLHSILGSGITVYERR